MALGTYVGGGGVKELKSCYVGAGGVKTVSGIYVGQDGSVKKVWPSYDTGKALLSFPSSDYWTAYRRIYDGSLASSYSEYAYYASNYIGTYIYNHIRNNMGGFVVTQETVLGAAIDYIGVESYCTDTCATTTEYDVYCSIASSQSSIISDDSGAGHYNYVTTISSDYRNHFLIDLTSCTRTGYFKYGYVVSNAKSAAYENNGWIYVTKVIVGNSTSFSDYNFSYGSSWSSTIKVT